MRRRQVFQRIFRRGEILLRREHRHVAQLNVTLRNRPAVDGSGRRGKRHRVRRPGHDDRIGPRTIPVELPAVRRPGARNLAAFPPPLPDPDHIPRVHRHRVEVGRGDEKIILPQPGGKICAAGKKQLLPVSAMAQIDDLIAQFALLRGGSRRFELRPHLMLWKSCGVDERRLQTAGIDLNPGNVVERLKPAECFGNGSTAHHSAMVFHHDAVGSLLEFRRDDPAQARAAGNVIMREGHLSAYLGAPGHQRGIGACSDHAERHQRR